MQVERFELSSSAWKADSLALNIYLQMPNPQCTKILEMRPLVGGLINIKFEGAVCVAPAKKLFLIKPFFGPYGYVQKNIGNGFAASPLGVGLWL
jgi:hypothetical protein